MAPPVPMAKSPRPVIQEPAYIWPAPWKAMPGMMASVVARPLLLWLTAAGVALGVGEAAALASLFLTAGVVAGVALASSAFACAVASAVGLGLLGVAWACAAAFACPDSRAATAISNGSVRFKGPPKSRIS